jgi:oligogalacturonide transport system substrate-binding protein
MWWVINPRNEVTLKAVKLFEKRYPSISIKAQYCGKSDYYTKLMFSLLGNKGADLVLVDWNMLNLIDTEYLLDLRKTGLDLNCYSPDLIKQCTIDDKVIGVPVNSDGRIFFYNKTTFDKAGIAIPKSFTDLYSAAAVFAIKFGAGYYPFIIDEYDAWLIALMFCEQKYGKPFIIKNRVAYSVEELKSGLDFYSDLITKGVAPSLLQNKSFGAGSYDQDLRWITGKIAGKCDWSQNAARVQRSVTNGEIVIGETPMDFGKTPGSIYKISNCYSICAQTKHPKEVALLLNFLLTDPEALEIQGVERGIPLNKVAVNALSKSGMLTGFSYEAQKKAEKYAGMGISPMFENAELCNFYKTEVIQKLARIGSNAAAEKAVIETNAYLKEFEEQ